ncbi:MAG: hypothetical protein LQ346_008913 [Caloplaca aetnensis]|nr:MAG: hypothetical protein LQ346_008913 [Caloplaca aetnensis]
MKMFSATFLLRCIIFYYLSPVQSRPSSWTSIIDQQPQAKSLLLYCATISLTQPECTTKFLNPDQSDTIPTSFVSFRAAATCVTEAKLTSTRLSDLFKIDTYSLSLLASSSSSTAPPNLDWQEMPDSSHWRATYSPQARKAAGEAARKAYVDYMQDIHKAEQIPGWVKPFMDKNDKAAERASDFGKLLMDASQAQWGVGEDKYKAAYNQPWTMGFRPDVACPADSGGCLVKKGGEGGGVDVVPSPEGEGSNAFDGPSGEGEKNEPEEDESEKSEWPEGMDEDPDLTEPIINDDEEVDVDVQDDLDATPVLQDETTRTAMQNCQAQEEKKLWDQIGSTTFDPEGQRAQSEEEKKAEAEHNRRLGFCDRSYYGEAGCREWKRQMDSVPLTPDAKLELEMQRQDQLDLCPVNLVKLTDCQLAKQSLYMRFAIPDATMETLNAKFKPGRAVDVIPRLDFMVLDQTSAGSMTGAQVAPLEVNEAPAINGNLHLQPLFIPRTAGESVPRPSGAAGGESPRIPLDPSSLGPSHFHPSEADSSLPAWNVPDRKPPNIPSIPSHEAWHDPTLNPPAIGGHTPSSFRPWSQGEN